MTSLTFDGGNDIYKFIHFLWTGETDEFDVTSLEGVDLCRNVERIHAAALLYADDLTPLLGLPKLRSVLLPEPPDGEAFDIIQELERRGVAIR